MWKKAHILYLIIIYRKIIWFWGGLARLVRLEYLTENPFDTYCRTGYNIVYSVQARFFFKFSMKQRPEFFSNFGWPDYLFYLQKLPDLTTLVVKGTDCTGSCKSNYHVITTRMASPFLGYWNLINDFKQALLYTLVITYILYRYSL
jgi:hypothetical protein